MKYIISGVVLCVVLIGVGVFISPSPQQGLWPGVKPEHISKLSLQSKFQADIKLELKHAVWQLSNGKKVRQDFVFRLLDDLLTMQQVRIVSHGHAHDQALGLQGERVHIQGLDAAGKKIFSVDVGKQAGDLISTYVRRGGEDQVITVNKALLWQVRRRMSAWLKVLPTNDSSVLEKEL